MEVICRASTSAPTLACIPSKLTSARRAPRAQASRRVIAVTAAVETPKSSWKSTLESKGFKTDEGIFGFTPFSELWVGRAAMIGFTSGVGVELATGYPILEQIGLMTDSQPDQGLFTLLLLAMTVPTAVGTVKTISDAAKGEMKVATFRRWIKLFALENAEEKVVYPSSPWPRQSREEIDSEMFLEFAKEIEMSNGRWAMVGFAAAILIEAATGGGVFQQFFWYSKFFGLLGADSGF